MSSVDLEVFEELRDKLQCEDSMKSLIKELCEGDLEIYEDEDIFKGDYSEYAEHMDKVLEEFGYEHLDQEGGGEGGAENCYGVFKLKGKIYKSEYGYRSYVGYYYDDILEDLREVQPVQKTITVYE